MKNVLRIAAAMFCCSFFTTISAQNLVVNPSFEITSSNCANFGGEGFFTDLAGSWDNASNNVGGDSCSSPDLFSSCNLFVTNAPNNVLGYQQPHSGTRYAGIITYEVLDQYREYIQGRVSSPLAAGQTYCVSMFVSLANTMPYATNNMGVYFSNTRYLRDPCPGQTNSGIYVTPQLNYTCSAITDTTANWFRLQWNYTATGGETYFIIGNFFNNAGTTIVNTGQAAFPNPFAYYFIDDVSIVPNTCCYAEISNHAPFCSTAAPSNLGVNSGTGTTCTPTLNGTWTGTGITSATTGTFSPAVAGVGQHLITYTLPCGYIDTMTVIVSPCQALVVCKETNGNLTVSNGVGPYTWNRQVQQQDCSGCFPAVPPFVQPCSVPTGCAVTVNAWQNFATGTSVTPPGTYPLQVVDASGTTLVISSLASLPNCNTSCSLTASAAPTATTCGNNNGSVTAAAIGGTATGYAWSNSGTTATISNLPSGTYTVTVTAGGCTATASAAVSSSTGITASASSTNSGCTSTGTATASITGGTATGYLWSNSGTTATISSLAAGNYSVTVTATGGCTASATTTVGSTGGITLSTSSTSATCGSSNGSATVNVTAGTAIGYSWSSGATTATASNLAAGNYTVIVTGAGGCSATASVSVGSTGAPTVTTSTTDAGCNSSTGSATVTLTSGNASAYAWSNSGTTATISNLAAGTYTVTVTGNGGCTVTASATVNATNGVVISATSTNTSCGANNGTASVTVTSGTATGYVWSNSAVTASLANLAAGTYTVTVNGAGGCSATASVVVGGSGANSVTITSDKSIICSNDSAHVIAPNGYVAYLWNNGATTSSIYVKLAGNYYVTVTDAGNCTATSNHLAIGVHPQPPVSISVNGDTLLAYNSITYQWYRNGVLIQGATNPLYVPSQSGSYTVEVSDANGCTALSLPVVITVTGIASITKETMSVYPNPNNDGNFNLSVSTGWIGATCQVFDAEGRLVYQAEIKDLKSEIGLNVANGVYMMRIVDGTKSITQKLIKF